MARYSPGAIREDDAVAPCGEGQGLATDAVDGQKGRLRLLIQYRQSECPMNLLQHRGTAGAPKLHQEAAGGIPTGLASANTGRPITAATSPPSS